MSDALEQAKEYLKDALQVYDREIMPAEVQFTAASIFVQIAIAERMERIAVVLEGVYDPDAAMLRVEAWTWDSRRELG